MHREAPVVPKGELQRRLRRAIRNTARAAIAAAAIAANGGAEPPGTEHPPASSAFGTGSVPPSTLLDAPELDVLDELELDEVPDEPDEPDELLELVGPESGGALA